MVRISRKLFSILSEKQKKYTVFIAFFMLFGGIMESLSVSLIMPLVTAIMETKTWKDTWYAKLICEFTGINDHRTYIGFLIVALIFVFLFKNGYLAWEYYLQYSFANKCKYRMQYSLMRDYLYKPYEFYLNSNTGEIIRIINGDTVQAFSVLENLLIFFTEIVVCVALGITIFAMSPGISIGIVIVLIIEVLVIAKVIRPKMVRLGEKQREESAIAYQWMLQGLDGIKTVKVTRNEQYFLDKYAYYFGDANSIDRIYQTLKNMPRLIIEAFTISAVLGAMFIMILMGFEMTSLIPVLSAFVLAAMRLLPSTNRISLVINQMPFLEGGLDNIIKIVNAKDKKDNLEDKSEANENENFKPNIVFNNEVCLNGITFSYPNSEKKILDHAFVKINAKQSVGFIGASGGGKTTTVDIILGLLKPDSGAVMVDGRNIRENLGDWLLQVAYIPQQIFLIDASIMENIALGVERQDIDIDRIHEVVYEAQLDELVSSMPNGIDTLIGEHGVRLSGGQKQRIGIARALYRKANFLIFDEATSALDNETEQAVMESIDHLRSKKTMVIIAHRLSTIANCDVVYRIENGKIIEEKNHEA